MKSIKIAVTISLICAISLGIEAADAPPDSIPRYRLEEIVVTAKRAVTPIEDLALSVSILDVREIELSLANSSTDLAGSLPGVFVQRTGAFGRSDINIRGLGSRGRRAAVLVDGHPERMALFDCTVTHSFLLHDVERIEVVRGPSSVIYGSGAMGGVMNVIPRRTTAEGELEFRTAAGNFDTKLATGRAGKDWGRASGVLSVDYRSSDGHIDNAAYEGFDAVGRLGLSLPRGMELTLGAKYFGGYKEEPLLLTASPGEVSDTWNDYRRGAADLFLEGDGRGIVYQGRYYHSFGEHEFSDGWHSRDATDGVTLHASGRPAAPLELAFGADARRQWGRLVSGDQGEWDKWEGGLYGTAEYAAADLLIISGGLRYNHDEYAGSILCPSAGLIVIPRQGTALRANASRGFRAPQLNELFMFPSSNAELDAETVWSYELGLRQRLARYATLDLAAFTMRGRDLIEALPNPSGPPPILFQNGESFGFRGVEAGLEVSAGRYLEGTVSYAYLDPGRWTRGRPGSKLDLSLVLRAGVGILRLTGRHVGDYYASNDQGDEIESYTLVGLYTETAALKGVKVFAGLDNLLDEEYALFVDLRGGEAGLYSMPGRTFIFGLKYGG
jgi:outer membrane receptor protein involved in Fe transport